MATWLDTLVEQCGWLNGGATGDSVTEGDTVKSDTLTDTAEVVGR